MSAFINCVRILHARVSESRAAICRVAPKALVSVCLVAYAERVVQSPRGCAIGQGANRSPLRRFTAVASGLSPVGGAPYDAGRQE
jgi:hypothetical protein